MHTKNLLWTPSITSHEIFFGKFTNIFEISNLTHPNAQSEAILTHPNAHSEPNLELSVNFDQSFGTCRQFLRGAGNFLAIYKGFHFGMEQLLAHCAMQLLAFCCYSLIQVYLQHQCIYLTDGATGEYVYVSIIMPIDHYAYQPLCGMIDFMLSILRCGHPL